MGGIAMKLRWIDLKGVSTHDVSELPDLRKRAEGFLWLDIPEWSDEAEALLTNEFHFHSMAIAESRNRNHIPRLHVYPHHVFIVVHAPEIGAGGHVHYLELDQFIGENFLITVHGPINPKVPLEAALRETQTVAARLESGRLHPTSPFGLTYAIVSSLARREAEMVAEIAREVGLLEQRVMTEEEGDDPQAFLSELFAARHELLTIKTMAEQGSEIYRRAIKLTTFAPAEGLALMKDVLDQYETVAHISDSQLRFLIGVTEFYRARTDTKMTIAAERLAVIAVLTLPITSLSSVVGMNVIVNDSTRWIPLIIFLLIMLAISLILLRWARRQGWW
ncbi:MAG TPA: magnesium transporter CorA family protein [Propionibacteriaceae bacterium]|nr:magnesium transporter CorA family protein [Propionibacteriaceae bacterium]